jgi:hypothetical protein
MAVTNSGISYPQDIRDLLRDVARARQRARGGRASVSALIVECVRAHESELRAELHPDEEVQGASK